MLAVGLLGDQGELDDDAYGAIVERDRARLVELEAALAALSILLTWKWPR